MMMPVTATAPTPMPITSPFDDLPPGAAIAPIGAPYPGPPGGAQAAGAGAGAGAGAYGAGAGAPGAGGAYGDGPPGPGGAYGDAAGPDPGGAYGDAAGPAPGGAYGDAAGPDPGGGGAYGEPCGAACIGGCCIGGCCIGGAAPAATTCLHRSQPHAFCSGSHRNTQPHVGHDEPFIRPTIARLAKPLARYASSSRTRSTSRSRAT